jgi:hypothetical protein
MRSKAKHLNAINEQDMARAFESGERWTQVTEIQRNLLRASESYADEARRVAKNLTEAAERIEDAVDWQEPKNSIAWVGGFEKLKELEGEIRGLSEALTIAAHWESQND